MSAPPQTKACGFLLFRGEPEESFLLMRHPRRWDLPKGHLDEGETELGCALRELEEETGITADDIDIDPHFRFTTQYSVCYKRFGDQPVPKTVVIFLARLKRDVPLRLTEHGDYEWFPWKPPHRIQEKTIDPLLEQVAKYRREGQ